MNNNYVKCPHCNKVFLFLESYRCPFCNKDTNNSIDKFKEMFGKDNPFKDIF